MNTYQEHVAMEWYWAYADWRDGLNFMTELYRYVLQKTFEHCSLL